MPSPDSLSSTNAERRPIAARGTAWANRLASALSTFGVAPNAISLAGLVCALLAGAALATTTHSSTLADRALWLAAAVFLQLRLLANMLDGMVAIETNRASPVGELYNEIPDRVSDAAILIGLGYAAGGRPDLGYIAACLAIFTAYVRAQGRATGAPQQFCGPMAKPQRMFVVTIVALFAAFAPRSWQPSGPASTGLASAALLLVIGGCVVTAARRLHRIARSLR